MHRGKGNTKIGARRVKLDTLIKVYNVRHYNGVDTPFALARYWATRRVLGKWCLMVSQPCIYIKLLFIVSFLFEHELVQNFPQSFGLAR